MDDLREAFGDELEAVGDWPAGCALGRRLVATLPVQDPARARKIADALTSVPIASAEWTREEKMARRSSAFSHLLASCRWSQPSPSRIK